MDWYPGKFDKEMSKLWDEKVRELETKLGKRGWKGEEAQRLGFTKKKDPARFTDLRHSDRNQVWRLSEVVAVWKYHFKDEYPTLSHLFTVLEDRVKE